MAGTYILDGTTLSVCYCLLDKKKTVEALKTEFQQSFQEQFGDVIMNDKAAAR